MGLNYYLFVSPQGFLNVLPWTSVVTSFPSLSDVPQVSVSTVLRM